MIGVNEDPHVERFMHAVLRLGEDLQLGVVVEGVETAAQADTLRRLGCRMAQGYYFARPAPAEALTAFVARPQLWGAVADLSRAHPAQRPSA